MSLSLSHSAYSIRCFKWYEFVIILSVALFWALLCTPSGALTASSLDAPQSAYSIHYKDDFNGNPGGIVLSLSGDGLVELSTYSTPYHPLQGYFGDYRRRISQDDTAELLKLLTSKEFAGEPFKNSIRAEEAYQRLALYKNSQEIFNHFYTTEALPGPLTVEIMRRLHEAARLVLNSKPLRGLAVELDPLPNIRIGETFTVRYSISNIGAEDLTIANFKDPALVTLFISGEGDKDSIYVELDHNKFSANKRPDAAGGVTLSPGDSLSLSYKVTASKLSPGPYYASVGSQLRLVYSAPEPTSRQVLIFAKPRTFEISQ